MKKEDRETYDAKLLSLERDFTLNGSAEPRRKVPSWWRGDEGAYQSNLAAARQLGYAIGGAG